MHVTSILKTLTPEQLTQLLKKFRSTYGRASGLRVDRLEEGQAWLTLPYQGVFLGEASKGILHGGVVTAMLDEGCGTAVQMALGQRTQIATLDLRIDYHKPAVAGHDLKAHSECTRLTRSIAFVRAQAYQSSESEPVATATACFMLGTGAQAASGEAAGAKAMQESGSDAPQKKGPTIAKEFREIGPLVAPDDPDGPFANSPFARCLGIGVLGEGQMFMPFSPKIVGNASLPALHGGMTGAFLETAAAVGVQRELGIESLPKIIDLTINYLRSGRALDSYANVSIIKQGRRVVAFEAAAWQDDARKPIATAFGHFLLPQG